MPHHYAAWFNTTLPHPLYPLAASSNVATAGMEAYLARGPIGQEVLNAITANHIDVHVMDVGPWMQVLPNGSVNILTGDTAGNVARASVPSIQAYSQSTTGSVLAGQALVDEVGSIVLHEGLHALGIGGSRAAELQVRLLQLEHALNRPLATMEQQWVQQVMNATGSYANLPAASNDSRVIAGRVIRF
jgi:hypothetical protein